MVPGPPEWFGRTFSTPRFEPYLRASSGDATSAWRLYRWNIEVSEAFYGPLHCLEIGLRNAEHDRLRSRYGRADWWTVAPLRQHDSCKITKALEDLRRKGVRAPSADDVVAATTFGLWVSLLSRAYDRHFWVPTLHRAFPHYSGGREPLRDNLQSMVLLRNRIMHHEPIHHRHLSADHAKIHRLLGYLQPPVSTWLKGFDRVPGILARRPVKARGDESA
ncbi:hypothetical protein [Sphaerisporangium corydalis]|uniref:Abi-like protein n=1 Tax=Sphaerisporangium corydalis TaxID=1441875 RepID=A0ABV9E550_9ACTN|nr:hypothetical protein [Sphaerisporangium corydalis]